jgi:hypothetical protein
MRAKVILISLMMTVFSLGNAQDIVDTSVLFSQSNYGGSARIQAIGGAQISLGGDISSISSNPAGLGMFNRSAISFSNGLNFISTKSDYFGTTTPDQKVNLNIPNMSIVINREINSKYTNFKNNSFGVSYSRINDFHQEATYQGRSESSMLDYFLQNAQGVFIQDFEDQASFDYNSLEGLAARAFLILPTSDLDSTGFDDEYIKDILGNPLQTETIAIKGAQTQVSFSFGANYDDILFLGGGIGLTSVDYTSRKTYTESDFIDGNPDDPDYINPLNQFSLDENLSITGSGINATLGVMFRPIDFLQIGGALTTPTYYSLDDESDASIQADYNDFDDESAENSIIISSYSLTTPLKLSAGATVFLGKHGFISADVEMLDYAKNNLKSDDFTTLGENQHIAATYDKSYNVKIGTELRHGIFRIRGGFAQYADPKDASVSDRQIISGGVGVKMKNYFIDLAIVNTSYSNEYSPYELNDFRPTADIRNNNTKGVVTIGANF